jgi:hypothetical protein
MIYKFVDIPNYQRRAYRDQYQVFPAPNRCFQQQFGNYKYCQNGRLKHVNRIFFWQDVGYKDESHPPLTPTTTS